MNMRHTCVMVYISLFLVTVAFAQNRPEAPIPIANTAVAETEKVDHFFTDLRKQINATKPHQITLSRFTKESAAFFVAIAAVQIESLIVDYSNNPRALQAHLESVKDPIGHLSFYMFMVANGYSTEFLKAGISTTDPLAKAQAYRRISYMGMAAGSIASSVTADVLTTVKECAKVLYNTSEQPKAEKLEVCNSALAQWTLNAKAQQYIPQIISLLVSTDVAQVVEARGLQLVSWASKKEFSKMMAAKATNALEVIGIDIMIALAPGGIVTKGLRVVGKVTQFAAFTYIDHLISPYVFRGFANVWQPASFDFDAYGFNSTYAQARGSNWNDLSANTKLAENLREIKKAMSNWRQSQLSQFYASHSEWGQMLTNIIDQTQTTYGFYKAYIDNLFSTLQVMNAIDNKKLPPEATRNRSLYPLRALPLYGVRLINELPSDYESADDLYLSNPNELETYQLETIREAAKIIKTEVVVARLNQADAALVGEIVQAFESRDTKRIGKALVKINDNTIYNKGLVGDYTLRNTLLKTRKFLGNPYPIFSPGMGYSYAYELNSYNRYAMKNLVRPSSPGRGLPKTSDYLLLQMICGAKDKFFLTTWGFSPSFLAPQIIAPNMAPSNLCQSQFVYDIYGAKATDTIITNIRPEILGNFRDLQEKPAFANWWQETVNSQLGGLYKQFDEQYVNVLEKMVNNWSDSKISEKCSIGSIKKCVGYIANTTLDKLNQGDYLEKDVLSNLQFEFNIYAVVLDNILKDADSSPMGNGSEFLRNIKSVDAFSQFENSSINLLKAELGSRLKVLRNIQVVNGKVINFPDKQKAKESFGVLSSTLKGLTDLVDSMPTPKKVVAQSALDGLEAVFGETSSLTMALYMTKYRLEDGYEDVMSGLRINNLTKEKRSIYGN